MRQISNPLENLLLPQLKHPHIGNLLTYFLAVSLVLVGLGLQPARCKPSKTVDIIVNSISKQLIKTHPRFVNAVAVMPFENTEGVVTSLGQLISDGLSKELVESKKLNIVERKHLDRIYQEWKLMMTGAVNQQSLQKIGEMAGASHLLVGHTQKIDEDEMMVFARLIKTESAEVLQAASAATKVDRETLRLNRALNPGEETKEDAIILPKKGPKGCIWVEVPGIIRFGDNETKKQAWAKAVARARQRAVMAVLDEEVSKEFSNFEETGFHENDRLIDSVLAATRNGRVMDEKILEEGVKDSKSCKACRYRVLLRACVSPRKKNADKGFQVSLNLNRTQFLDGDEARVIINVTRKSYIYVLSVDQTGQGVVAFPNDLIQDNTVEANQTFVYPDARHKKSGIRLIAELPEGENFSAETLRVLATKKPVEDSLLKERYDKILSKLVSNNVEWCEDSNAFTIRKK